MKELANICLSCPPLLLQVIRDVSRFCRQSDVKDQRALEVERLLSIVDAFDAKAWAQSLQQVSLSFDLDMRIHIGCAYQAAVKIYVLRAAVVSKPCSVVLDSLEDLVSEVISHLHHVPSDDPFFKTTCWPSFIAGAETNEPDQRFWVSNRFETALRTLPWGYLSNAVELLERIWAGKQDEEAGTNWLIDLKLSDNDWLIA